jgi:hypothetical protein
VGLITGRLRRRATRRLAGLGVLREADANSFGVESAGKRQVRGNGSLALTEEELVFAQWVPDRIVRIPRASIIEVTTPRSHLGKTMFRKLLKVTWETESGAPDSIALLVRDLDAWVEAVQPATSAEPLNRS